MLLLIALQQFYKRAFPERPDLRRIAFWLCALGSGMGWLLLFRNQPTADFWVAEAYPFLSMLTNPHFPTGLALILFSLILLISPQVRYRNVYLLILGLITSIVFNFGMVILMLVSVGRMVWFWVESRRLEWQPVFWLGLLGGPSILYQLWVVQSDPVLSLWNSQNVTLSPPVWDLFLSFSPALLLVPFGMVHLLKMKQHPLRPILMVWLALELLLVYFPVSLQRRFLLGLYIPTVGLAVFGIDFLRQKYAQRVRLLVPVVMTLALPTSLLMILIGIFGAFSHAPLLYLSRDEARAIEWIRAETPARALVLASPEMGAFIPAFTGRRVIYGHPFETVHATLEEGQVLAFYRTGANRQVQNDFLKERKIDYILYGSRERLLGDGLDLSAYPNVFQSGLVQIYSARAAQ